MESSRKQMNTGVVLDYYFQNAIRSCEINAEFNLIEQQTDLIDENLEKINSYEYLHNYANIQTENECVHFHYKEDRTFIILFNAINKKYDPTYAYGNLYTRFLIDLEEKINDGKHENDFIKQLIYYVYNN